MFLIMLHSKPISQLVKKVKVVEVGPRDGLQNEKVCEIVWNVYLEIQFPFLAKEELMFEGNLHQVTVFTFENLVTVSDAKSSEVF